MIVKRGGGAGRVGRPAKYPWDRWFAKDYFCIVRGVDFHLSMAMMDVTVRNNGRQRGLSLSVVGDGDKIHVWVRARRRVSLAD